MWGLYTAIDAFASVPLVDRKAVDTMKRNTLYGSLLAGLYALDGADGEFLGTLAQPIRIPWNVGSDEVTLVEFPAQRVADLQEAVDWHREAIDEEIEMAMQDAGEFDPNVSIEDLLEDCMSSTAEYVRDLREDLALLEDRLAAL